MTRRRRRANSSSRAAMRRMRTQATQAALAFDIARYSAETIYYRMAMMRQVLDGTASAYDPEFFAMMAEKLLAGGQAAAIALRQIGPAQRAWTRFWFGRLQPATVAPPLLSGGKPSQRLFWDAVTLWSRSAGLMSAALLSQSRPIQRTVAANARRLRAAA